MRFILSLLLAAAVLVPSAARAETTHITWVHLTNGTAHWIYVDSYAHHGKLQHWGLVAPSSSVMVDVTHPGYAFFTDVYVYVKRIKHVDAEDTICTVKKTFGNTGMHALQEHVHFNGKTCTIDPA